MPRRPRERREVHPERKGPPMDADRLELGPVKVALLRRQFAGVVDYIVPGDCGPASGPSEIRDYASGRVLRPRTT